LFYFSSSNFCFFLFLFVFALLSNQKKKKKEKKGVFVIVLLEHTNVKGTTCGRSVAETLPKKKIYIYIFGPFCEFLIFGVFVCASVLILILILIFNFFFNFWLF
jgi:hypothetical protein